MQSTFSSLAKTIVVAILSFFELFAAFGIFQLTEAAEVNGEGLPGRIIYSAPSMSQSDTSAFIMFDGATLTSSPFPVSNVVYISTSPDGQWVIGWETTGDLTAEVAYNLYSFDGMEQRYLFHEPSEFYVDSFWLDDETVMLTYWQKRGVSLNSLGLGARIVKPFHTPATVEVPVWSRDTSIAIIAIEPTLQIALAYDPLISRHDLFLLDMSTNLTFPIAALSLVAPDISSTGQIALSERIIRNSNNYYEDLEIIDYWSLTKRTLVDFSDVPGRTDISLVNWSPNGQLLAFEMGIEEITSDINEVIFEGTYHLYVYDTQRNRLLSSEASMVQFTPDNLLWSPDNRFIAFIDSNSSMCVLNVESGEIDCLIPNVTALIDWSAT